MDDEELRAEEYRQELLHRSAFAERQRVDLRGSESARLSLESKTFPLRGEQDDDIEQEREWQVANS